MAKARVRYKGFSDVREITAKQLEPLGISVDRDLVFSRANSYAINVDLNDELTKVLRDEGTFTISEIKDDSTIGDDIVTATLADDTQVAADSLNQAAGLVTASSGPTGAPPTPKK